jgi:hypothetical protein
LIRIIPSKEGKTAQLIRTLPSTPLSTKQPFTKRGKRQAFHSTLNPSRVLGRVLGNLVEVVVVGTVRARRHIVEYVIHLKERGGR